MLRFEKGLLRRYSENNIDSKFQHYYVSDSEIISASACSRIALKSLAEPSSGRPNKSQVRCIHETEILPRPGGEERGETPCVAQIHIKLISPTRGFIGL